MNGLPDPDWDKPVNPLFNRLPSWGLPGPPLVGPGPAGPDYAAPRAPQAGEGVDLLPSYPGSLDDRAAAHRDAIRRGLAPRAAPRLPPYLVLVQPVIYSGTAAQNVVSLGKPSKGWRWIIRELAVLPGDSITSGGGAGLTVHWYAGQMPAVAAFPALSDWIWQTPTSATAVPPQVTQFTGDALQILDNQYLVAYVSGSTGGYESLVMARVLHVPDGAATATVPI